MKDRAIRIRVDPEFGLLTSLDLSIAFFRLVWKAAFGARPCDLTGEFGASVLDDLSAVITAGDAPERRAKFFAPDCRRQHLQFLFFDLAAPTQN